MTAAGVLLATLRRSSARVLCCGAALRPRAGKWPVRAHFAARAGLALDDGAGQWPLQRGTAADEVEALLSGSPLDTTERRYSLWERQTHALFILLVTAELLSVEELRREVDALDPASFGSWGYYDKWAAAMCAALLRQGTLPEAELDAALGSSAAGCWSFGVGDAVRVRAEGSPTRWRKPHLPTPGYIFGAVGVVESRLGGARDPEFMAFRGDPQAEQPLYRVRFRQCSLWPEQEGDSSECVDVDIVASWLEPAPDESVSPTQEGGGRGGAAPAPSPPKAPKLRRLRQAARTLAQELHDAGHAEHAHCGHTPRAETEQNAAALEGPEQPGQRVAEALIGVLCRGGAVSLEGLRRAVEALDAVGTRAEGPRLVARAWTDPDFKQRLLKDACAAAAELGVAASQSTAHASLTVVESTERVHNVVVCTLCSCYPVSILGLSPPWYRSRSYRARAAREPRMLLREAFGLELGEEVEVRVHDSTAEQRYLVLPRRPPGTEGWSEEQLCSIVTRDTMIGVAVPRVPAGLGS